MSMTDVSWAIEVLNRKLTSYDNHSAVETTVNATRPSWFRPVPQAVKNMTVMKRKDVAYDNYDDYIDELTTILNKKYE